MFAFYVECDKYFSLFKNVDEENVKFNFFNMVSFQTERYFKNFFFVVFSAPRAEQHGLNVEGAVVFKIQIKLPLTDGGSNETE